MTDQTWVAPWVRAIVEEMVPKPLEVGRRYRRAGQIVQITGGAFWGRHGLSNHWSWSPVLPDGSLGPADCGYNDGGFEPLLRLV